MLAEATPTNKSPYELVLDRLRRENPPTFNLDRNKIVMSGLDYAAQILAEQGYSQNDRMKFFAVFQLFMMYEFAAITAGYVTPDGTPDISRVHALPTDVRNEILGKWSNTQSLDARFPGDIFRDLFTDIKFLSALAENDITSAHSYALGKFRAAFPHLEKNLHAAGAA